MILASFFTSLARSKSIAIDLGTAVTKSSAFNSTSFPTMTENSESKRLTPTCIAFRLPKSINTSKPELFTNEELEEAIPSIGQKASGQIDFRPHLGAGYFMYHIDTDDEVSKKFEKTVFLNKSISRFDFEDTLALYLNMYATSVSAEKEVNTLSVIVPATFTAKQREIVSNAIKNSKNKYGGIITDNEATFTYYGVERIRMFNDKPQTVLFIDIGATSIKAYAGRFVLIKNTKLPTANVNITKLSYAISNKEGGAFVTSRMVNHFIKTHNLKNLTPAEYRRLFTACEKLKAAISFSAIHQSSTVVEDVGGHEELRLVIKEEELLQMIKPVFEEATKVVKEATNNVTFDTVQIIGGSSRLFNLTNNLQEVLNMTINANLNADETVAFGGGYVMQYNHKHSRLSAIGWSDEYPVLSVEVEYNSKTEPVCQRGINCTNEINLTDVENEITLKYKQSELPLPVKHLTFPYTIYNNSKTNLTAFFRKSIVALEKLHKYDNETNFTTVSFGSPSVSISHSQYVSTVLRTMAKRRNIANARMKLEQLTHKILDDIEYNETFKSYMSPSQVAVVTNAANKMKTWINDHADKVKNESLFTAPYQELMSYVQPVWDRIEERTKLQQFEQLLRSTVQRLMMTSLLEWPVNKSWIPAYEVKHFSDLLNATQMMGMKLTQQLKEVPLYENIDIKSNEIRENAIKLLEEFQRIDNIPKPVEKTKKEGFFSKVKNFFGFGDKNKKYVDPTESKSTPTPTPPKSTPKPKQTAKPASSETPKPSPSAEPEKKKEDDQNKKEL
ncbi:hypothetical protein TVAG_201610 [Trichomonas vaginalis G3]|uniref:DnaK protein n=1 Tax=Trichomonas vaginalis (strain ATCC PRA-98 / G3) TaxID=412133 RepID=A2DWI2_TRIV3|nr:ATP binding [Trichomonas vaginalis G3]EAY15167.1 hypothetical protein TVAG_201610 [Trichomonas vaginalis G3]KAI5550683.1 ATP binding [Trichomonas vaginalis G3]|eukprot:XP_001327390.1 hypothetical protein [Trichomonas vaginalis G3]